MSRARREFAGHAALFAMWPIPWVHNWQRPTGECQSDWERASTVRDAREQSADFSESGRVVGGVRGGPVSFGIAGVIFVDVADHLRASEAS
jgi:hypothetical protein